MAITDKVDRRVRVVVAKPGRDDPDRGAESIARALRDAGMEVIYTGPHQSLEQIVETVIQEDADAVRLPILSGPDLNLARRALELLREQDITDFSVTVAAAADEVLELVQSSEGHESGHPSEVQ